MLHDEVNDGRRIIFENEDFICFHPFFLEYPYGVYIASKAHKQYLTEFTGRDKDNLAKALREAAGTLDNLFGYTFPYMMCMHQGPVNSGDTSDYYHFHIEFFPPMRSADKQKFNASSEIGSWAHCNPTAPEATSEELGAAHKKYIESQK